MAATTVNVRLKQWVNDWAEILQPESIYWCDGSAEEYEALCQSLVDAGTFTKLDEAKRPNSYWAHSDPGDVARIGVRPVAVRALGLVELRERARVDERLAEGLVLLGGAVAPVDRLGLEDLGPVVHPLLQADVDGGCSHGADLTSGCVLGIDQGNQKLATR